MNQAEEDLISLMLPEGILEYFELTKVDKVADKIGLVVLSQFPERKIADPFNQFKMTFFLGDQLTLFSYNTRPHFIVDMTGIGTEIFEV